MLFKLILACIVVHAFSPSFLEAEAEGFLSTVQTLCPTAQASIVSAEKLALG